MIHPERLQRLNQHAERNDGKFVLYWMQASQRFEYNHALEYAIDQANQAGKPLVAVFALTDDYPGANWRHYRFMIEGLRETRTALVDRGVQLVVQKGEPAKVVSAMAKQADLVVTDCGYTRVQWQWRKKISESIDAPLVQVESDVVVPVQAVSNKQEFAARTIRPKIHRLLPDYLTPLKARKLKNDSLGLRFEAMELDNEDALKKLKVDRSAKPSNLYRGGISEAQRHLDDFIVHKLDHYDQKRNDPSIDFTSHMSPYLHFGQISPLQIALRIMEADSPGEHAFLEEMIVRRELAINFVAYNPHYDTYEGLPDWCRKTLDEHAGDRRDMLYTKKQLEQAQTHDPYWNAAQREMVCTGKMHGYMRMYWGKKILEWNRDPASGFAVAVALNDKYELDGRDPNGYTGVAWCFGLHDRPWAERPIFGKIRYMNDKGLRRKFDADAYVAKVERLCRDTED